jgi:hypothetical protein
MLMLDNLYGVFCDALLCDDGQLVFVSLWGRDTAIQELLAKLSIPVREGGLRELKFTDLDDQSCMIADIGDPDRLDKMSGRMPKNNLFGDIVHLWLFDQRAKQPDYVNHKAYLLLLDVVDKTETSWKLVKAVSHLPLLDHWRSEILSLLIREGWLSQLKGYHLDAIRLYIPEDAFNQVIGEKVRQGELTLPTLESGGVL